MDRKTDGHVVRDTGTPPPQRGPQESATGKEMGSLKQTQKRKKSLNCHVRNKINCLEPNRAIDMELHAWSVSQSCLSLCDPMDCSPPSSSVHGIPQTRTARWVAMPSSRGSSQLRDQTHVSCVSCFGKWVLNLGRVQKGRRAKNSADE